MYKIGDLTDHVCIRAKVATTHQKGATCRLQQGFCPILSESCIYAGNELLIFNHIVCIFVCFLRFYSVFKRRFYKG